MAGNKKGVSDGYVCLQKDQKDTLPIRQAKEDEDLIHTNHHLPHLLLFIYNY